MKVGVVGSRNFRDKELLYKVLDEINPALIISGGARGADMLAYVYAMDRGIVFTAYPPKKADIERYGFSRAAKRRNLLIADACELLVAFPLPESRGTWHTVSLAKKLNKEVKIVTSDGS